MRLNRIIGSTPAPKSRSSRTSVGEVPGCDHVPDRRRSRRSPHRALRVHTRAHSSSEGRYRALALRTEVVKPRPGRASSRNSIASRFGGTASGPQHPFLGDLSELMTGCASASFGSGPRGPLRYTFEHSTPACTWRTCRRPARRAPAGPPYVTVPYYRGGSVLYSRRSYAMLNIRRRPFRATAISTFFFGVFGFALRARSRSARKMPFFVMLRTANMYMRRRSSERPRLLSRGWPSFMPLAVDVMRERPAIRSACRDDW